MPANFITDKKYIVEKISFSSGVKVSQRVDQIIAYKTPAQQLYSLSIQSSKWVVGSPIYSSPFMTAKYQDKTAVMKISDYLGKVEVTYQ